MREGEAKRKYYWELGLGFAFYLGVLVAQSLVLDRMQPGVARTLVAAAPIVPVFVMVWVIARSFGRMDEFVRLRSLESIGVAAAVTAGVTFTYGFLENAGFPRQSAFWVWAILGFTWGVHSCLRCFWSK